MKILIIHNEYKQKGGEDSVVENEIGLLKSHGVTVELLKFSNKNNALLKTLLLPFNYISYLKVKQKIASFKPDAVHIHNLHFAASPSIIFAVKKTKTPFVITLHNYRLLCPSATLFNNGHIFLDAVNKGISWKAIFNGVYLNSRLLTFWVSCSMLFHQHIGTWELPDTYIGLAEHTKDIFSKSKLKSITNKIIVKPNFCYPQAKTNLAEGKYYLFIGRLSTEKGVETLLKAFAENGLPLLIAGRGPLGALVAEAAKNHKNISFIGSVKKDKVAELLTETIALIFPSEWYETFGMVIIEAFAAGVPVIASSLGQLKTTIQDKINGLHFESGNSKSLVEAVTYYQQISLTEKLSYKKEALHSYQEFYSPECNAEQLIGIYKQMLAEI